MRFRPTRPPAERLLRLGVILDTRNTPARLREIARMGDRAGVDALWVADPVNPLRGRPRLEAWTGVTLAGLDTSRVRVGAMLEIGLRPSPLLGAMVRSLEAAIGGRLEIGLLASGAGGEAHAPGAIEDYVARLREVGADAPVSLEVRGSDGIALAARVADDAVLRGEAVPDLLGTIGRVRAGCEAVGRDPESLGIAVELLVSIGRTWAEAEARARAGEGFRMAGVDPRAVIVGTLEQCQDRVIELAHAGVTELRCGMPNTPDIHDAIAQLTAMAVGTLGALTPSAPRSAAPAPPDGWGGRSLRP